jgi:hypothetical protein
MNNNSEAPLIGYDLGAGGGDNAQELPCLPYGMPLVTANQTYTIGEIAYPAIVEIWGLDPRLNVTFSVARVHKKNDPTFFTPGNITATIRAQLLFRTSDGVQVGPDLPIAQLFTGGGALDDGCELVTAAQGVRFAINWVRSGNTSHEIIGYVQARPNVALGCSDLFRKLVQSLRVIQTTPTINPGFAP